MNLFHAKFRNPDPIERLLDSVHPWQREEYVRLKDTETRKCWRLFWRIFGGATGLTLLYYTLSSAGVISW